MSFGFLIKSKSLTFFLLYLVIVGWELPSRDKLFLSEDLTVFMMASVKVKQFANLKDEECLGSVEIIVDLFS